jgi:hypothetical protein
LPHRTDSTTDQKRLGIPDMRKWLDNIKADLKLKGHEYEE